MFIERIVSEGLAHFSYIAGNDNYAFVVDPKRDVDQYNEIAKSNCYMIRFVFETHCNEDYLIGSLELEQRTGCRIIHSDRLDFGYGEPARENDTFDIGGIRIRVIETPSHSPESLSFVLNPFIGEILDIKLSEKPEKRIALSGNFGESFVQKNGGVLCLGCMENIGVLKE